MSTLDLILLVSAKVALIALLVAVIALLGYMAFCWVYKIVRNAIGWPLMTEAIREYRKAHPERFRAFDKSQLRFFQWWFD